MEEEGKIGPFGLFVDRIETNEDGVALVDKPEDVLPGTVAIFDDKYGKWGCYELETKEHPGIQKLTGSMMLLCNRDTVMWKSVLKNGKTFCLDLKSRQSLICQDGILSVFKMVHLMITLVL